MSRDAYRTFGIEGCLTRVINKHTGNATSIYWHSGDTDGGNDLFSVKCDEHGYSFIAHKREATEYGAGMHELCPDCVKELQRRGVDALEVPATPGSPGCGRRVAAMREALGWSASKLAKLLDVDRSTVSRLETYATEFGSQEVRERAETLLRNALNQSRGVL